MEPGRSRSYGPLSPAKAASDLRRMASQRVYVATGTWLPVFQEVEFMFDRDLPSKWDGRFGYTAYTSVRYSALPIGDGVVWI